VVAIKTTTTLRKPPGWCHGGASRACSRQLHQTVMTYCRRHNPSSTFLLANHSCNSRPDHRCRRRLQPLAASLGKDDLPRGTPGTQAENAAAAAAGSSSNESQAAVTTTTPQITPGALWRFSRPHTIWGTAISVVSISLLAFLQHVAAAAADAFLFNAPAPAVPWMPFAATLASALVAALLANVAIVGINQVYDVEIDRINKPELPLAAGEMSVATGKAVSIACAIVALACAAVAGTPSLLATVGASLALGFAYSVDLPFLRWKRNPTLAAACIFGVRAIAVQLGFYDHASVSLARASGWPMVPPPPAAVWFGVCFMTAFSVAIALCKDLPDTAGDAKHGVRTMSVRAGRKGVFRFAVAMLLCTYALAASVIFIAGLGGAFLPVNVVTALAHVALGAVLFLNARRVDADDDGAIKRFYMMVWKLFYAEYFLLPFVYL